MYKLNFYLKINCSQAWDDTPIPNLNVFNLLKEISF